MIIELSDEYLPEKVLHRDKQIKEIREVFKNFKKLGMGTNLVLLGVTGSGKTVIIKKVIELEDNAVYVSGAETKTPFKTIKAIYNINSKTHEELLRRTIEKLKENPKIIVIDEIDKIKNFSQFCDDLNTIYRKTMIPIIIISLRRNILDQMPSDARKTLFFEKITLPSYNSVELKEILTSRIKLINRDFPGLTSGTINYISAISAKQGSARVLMNITLKCLQKNTFSQKFIAEIYQKMMKEDWVGFVNDINETEKEFLYILLDLCSDGKEVPAEALEKKMGRVSGARISQLINVFERYDVIKSRHENLGRLGGRRRLVKFTSDEIYKELNKMVGFK